MLDIALTMIVKDEAHVIERCLESVRPLITSWAIVDTGSTDGTQDVVRRALADLPGELIERPWVDFAHNRNESLDHARMLGADYAFVIDADDVLEVDEDFRVPPDLDDAGYWLPVHVGAIRMRRPHLLRLDLPWHYVSVVHEYAAIANVDGERDAVRVLKGIARARIRTLRDGARWQRRPDALAADAAAIETALVSEPDDERLRFYLAQTYNQQGRFADARDAYLASATPTAWPEQVYQARLAAARMLALDGGDVDAVLAEFEAVRKGHPQRAEPLVDIAQVCRTAGRHPDALEAARSASTLPEPDGDTLFVETDAYGWRRAFEHACAALACGERFEALERAKACADDPDTPEQARGVALEVLAQAASGPTVPVMSGPSVGADLPG